MDRGGAPASWDAGLVHSRGLGVIPETAPFRAQRQSTPRLPLCAFLSQATADRPCSGDMTIQRMDNVLIVVDDLEAAKAFFAELGMELEGETQVEGSWVDRTVGLDGVRADIAMNADPGRLRPG